MTGERCNALGLCFRERGHEPPCRATAADASAYAARAMADEIDDAEFSRLEEDAGRLLRSTAQAVQREHDAALGLEMLAAIEVWERLRHVRVRRARAAIDAADLWAATIIDRADDIIEAARRVAHLGDTAGTPAAMLLGVALADLDTALDAFDAEGEGP